MFSEQFHQANGHGDADHSAAATERAIQRKRLALRLQLVASVTPEVFQDLIDALVTQARAGHVGAIKLLLQYARTQNRTGER